MSRMYVYSVGRRGGFGLWQFVQTCLLLILSAAIFGLSFVTCVKGNVSCLNLPGQFLSLKLHTPKSHAGAVSVQRKSKQDVLPSVPMYDNRLHSRPLHDAIRLPQLDI